LQSPNLITVDIKNKTRRPRFELGLGKAQRD